MPIFFRWSLTAIVLSVFASGCGRESSPGDESHQHGAHEHDDASIAENLAKLSPEDRRLADEQGYCANEPESKLGSMGVPLKLTVKDKPVFVCCRDCSQHVLEHPDESLAAAETLKAKTRAAR